MVTKVAVSAAASGLQADDVIVEVDGRSTLGLGRHTAKVVAFTLRPKTSVHWTVIRDGKKVKLVYQPA